MRHLLILAAMAALLLPGCAAMSGGGPSDEAVAQCQAQADEAVKSRYTDQWQAAVDQCLERRVD